MSHFAERKEKDCLNCGATVVGRYCHVCGQENKEPKETVWHLITHLFNDITHFDGKFFSSLKYLISKPGFLSREYARGRRQNYLNPIRMYLFTSAIFFLIYFSFLSPEEKFEFKGSKWEDSVKQKIDTMTDAQFKTFIYAVVASDSAFTRKKFLKNFIAKERKKQGIISVHNESDEDDYMDDLENKEHRWLYNKIRNWQVPVDSFQNMSDSTFNKFLLKRIAADSSVSRTDFNKHLKRLNSGLMFGHDYKSREEYDSLIHAGKVKDGWFEQWFTYKQLELNKKYNNNTGEIISNIRERFNHSIPQMLFVSLPIMALILKLLYRRRKNFYYVDHAIFVTHVYIFIFLTILVIIGISLLETLPYLSFLGYLRVAILLAIFFYVYKAMRNFYQQRRFKTIVKFLLLLLSTLFTTLFLFALFFTLSLLRI